MLTVQLTPRVYLRRLMMCLGLTGLCTGAGFALATESPPPTRAQVQVTEVASGLEHPWSLAFLPDGFMLITERPGRLRMLDKEGRLSEPIQGVPDVAARSQGGLFDVLLSPGFEDDRLVYLSYAESDGQASGTAVGRGRLSGDARQLTDFSVIFRQRPKLSSGQHFGGRMVFGQDGMLYIALGENNRRSTAQDLDKHQGKIVRIHADGRIPDDNPFVAHAGALPEIWTYGHRNPQGMAFNPWTAELWEHEHGPRGGDEINIIRPGLNYGWPLATHGVDYTGSAIPEARGSDVEGTEPPLLWWRKSPAISGMAFYDHSRFPEWKGSLFIGALAARSVIRLTMDGNNSVAEERLLLDRGDRIRDVRQGPDGYVYILTDAAHGALLRIAPASSPVSLRGFGHVGGQERLVVASDIAVKAFGIAGFDGPLFFE